MAKANNESNFEKLKEKMLQKRDIVERRFESDTDEPESMPQKKTSENINTNNDSNINSDINGDINSDSNVNSAVNSDRTGTITTTGNVNIDGDTNRNISDDRNVSVNRNNNGNNCGNIDSTSTNAFILKVEKREDVIKRQSYYLKNSTIKKIDDISLSSGIGKSELVQRILEEALNNIQIVSI